MFAYEFMRNAFAAATIAALMAGAVGYFLVLRGQTFAGHALAHVGFTGATGSILVGLPPFPGLVLLTVLAGFAMGALGDRLRDADIAIGIVLALALGFGLLFLHFFTSSATEASALLFGNVFAVARPTLWALLGLATICLIGLSAISRPLLFASLHPELAAAKGVPVRRLSVLFLVLVALATAAAARIVGVLLVFTLMVGPAAAAQRFAFRVGTGVLVAIGLAIGEAWLGLILSYQTDWPSSFWIAALSGAIYLAAWILSRPRGGA